MELTTGKALTFLVVLTAIVGAVALGPARAWHIGIAAVAERISHQVPGRVVHRVPVYEVEVAQADLDSLNADLPWSGNQQMKASLLFNGLEHEAKLRYRGLYATTHFMGNKKSFRLSLKKGNPFDPLRRVNLINPKAFNMVNDHMALWIAGSMGVAVPYDEMVHVRMNGLDYGVMELFEQINGKFEEVRNLASDEVPVFKGDFPPAVGRELAAPKVLWRSASHWEYASDADSTQAKEKLAALCMAINAKEMSDKARWDSIAAIIDVEAFLRYYAAIKLINTKHIDHYHNHWLVWDQRIQRFYPILWDPLMMFPPPGEPPYPIHDGLAYWILRRPEWRFERDQYLYSGWKTMHADRGFATHLAAVLDRIRPSIMADANRSGVLTDHMQDVFSYGNLQYAASADALLATASAYWDRLGAVFEVRDAHMQISGGAIVVKASTAAPITVDLQCDRAAENAGVVVEGDTIQLAQGATTIRFELHPKAEQVGGKPGKPHAPGARYDVAPLDARIHLFGLGNVRVRIMNASTGEALNAGK